MRDKTSINFSQRIIEDDLKNHLAQFFISLESNGLKFKVGDLLRIKDPESVGIWEILQIKYRKEGYPLYIIGSLMGEEHSFNEHDVHHFFEKIGGKIIINKDLIKSFSSAKSNGFNFKIGDLFERNYCFSGKPDNKRYDITNYYLLDGIQMYFLGNHLDKEIISITQDELENLFYKIRLEVFLDEREKNIERESEKPELQTYNLKINTFLKDSNAYGNTYFSRYFDWQGMAREAWCHDCIDKNLLKDHGILVTREANNEYFKETFPFQEIICEVSVLKAEKFIVELEFVFKQGNELIARGNQKLLLVDKEKNLIRFPKFILDRMLNYSKRK